jgi:AcrR family transcriptional regulator
MARLAAPKQARSRRTLERIVAAGIALLEEGGPEAVTVQAVVAKARSSVGSFYARFKGKEDLLAHLRERVRETAETAWSETLGAEAWETSLEGAAARAVDLLLDSRPEYDARIRTADRLLSTEVGDEEPRRKAIDELAVRLLERRDEITHPDPERAVRIGLAAVLGVGEHARAVTADASEAHPDALRTECTHLLLAYLTGRPRGDAGPVDFFDVWS